MRLLWISSVVPGGESELLPQAGGETAIEFARDGSEALRLIRASRFDALVACLPMASWNPEELLEAVQQTDRSLPVILYKADGRLSDAVRLTRLGAFHFLGPGATAAELTEVVESAAQSIARAPRNTSAPEMWRQFLIGDSQAMREVAEIVRLIGNRRSTVLITGETGTGKEMVARAIHQAGSRSHWPLVAVNCSALPENLLEAELFGHVRGAFTGAIQHRVGRFEQAHRGTLFLDEIGDMPLELQSKLLRVLQEREFQRIGSSETIQVDVRVIAATNVNLVDLVRQRKFREDLFYRLNVVPVAVPPLRERLGDIPALVRHFVEKICRQEQIPVRRVYPETLDRLARYWWPGNVRQLENAVEMAIALSGAREVLYPGDFSLPMDLPCDQEPGTRIAVPDSGLDFETTVGRIELQILEEALRKTRGNKKQAAEMLRLKRTTLAAKLKSLEAVAAASR
jgi:DNA-binding NtrC family response regulator